MAVAERPDEEEEVEEVVVVAHPEVVEVAAGAVEGFQSLLEGVLVVAAAAGDGDR